MPPFGFYHREGLRERNWYVYEEALTRDIPLVTTMGGGYPRDLDADSAPFREIVDAHVDVYKTAAEALSLRQELLRLNATNGAALVRG